MSELLLLSPADEQRLDELEGDTRRAVRHRPGGAAGADGGGLDTLATEHN